MIITDKFVMLNLPKTGCTFARNAIKKLYEPYFRKFYPQYWLPYKKAFELILPTDFVRDKSLKRKLKASMHSGYTQVPEKYRDRILLSVIRNPYDRLLSIFHFADWKVNLALEETELKRLYPGFPDLSFEEFLDMHYEHSHKHLIHGLKTHFIYGPQTAQFIAFFAKDPVKTFESINGEFSIKDNLDQFADVRFLHTENLNQELHDFLLTLKYKESKISFIKTMKRMKVSKINQAVTLTPEWKKLIYEKEKPLFELFSEYK